MNGLFPDPYATFPKLCGNPSSTSCVVLLTIRQTNSEKNLHCQGNRAKYKKRLCRRGGWIYHFTEILTNLILTDSQQGVTLQDKRKLSEAVHPHSFFFPFYYSEVYKALFLPLFTCECLDTQTHTHLWS